MEPLRGKPGFRFYNARPDFRYDATDHLLLAVDAPVIGFADREWMEAPSSPTRSAAETVEDKTITTLPSPPATRALLILDATWRLLPSIEDKIYGLPRRRGLPPGLHTAYPRQSKIAEDPVTGLATIEALYLALRLLGHNDPAILASYHWREAFLNEVDKING